MVLDAKQAGQGAGGAAAASGALLGDWDAHERRLALLERSLLHSAAATVRGPVVQVCAERPGPACPVLPPSRRRALAVCTCRALLPVVCAVRLHRAGVDARFQFSSA